MKSHKDRNRHKEQNKKEWASWVGLCQRHKPQNPHHVRLAHLRVGERERGGVGGRDFKGTHTNINDIDGTDCREIHHYIYV